MDYPTAMDYDMPQLFARDAELMERPLSNGAKYMTGGAGEGSQRLHPDGQFEWREQVKTDSSLPAYCQPPNPCPRGYSNEKDGCLDTEKFDNTADFSKKYQESQNCICDEEHMHGCPKEPQQQEAGSDNFDMEYDQQNFPEHHQAVVAKKGDPNMNPLQEHYPRRKRSAGFGHKRSGDDYSWLQGERLIRVAKKG
jgi:hypothetical protein